MSSAGCFYFDIKVSRADSFEVALNLKQVIIVLQIIHYFTNCSLSVPSKLLSSHISFKRSVYYPINRLTSSEHVSSHEYPKCHKQSKGFKHKIKIKFS